MRQSKVLIATLSFALSGLAISPAYADHGSGVTFPCGTSGSYIVADGVLTGHTACVGNLNIDSSVVEIADYAFAGNSDLAAINIPGSVLTVGVQAFNGASATSLTLGEGIIEIKSDAFSSLNTSGSSLDITIPDTVTTLGDAVFQQNTIGSLIIGDSLVNIPTQAFYSNAGSGPTSVEFGSSVENIGNASFFGYRGRSLELPEGIETIASGAFWDASINALFLPVSLTSISDDAFSLSPNTTVYCGTNPDIINYAFPEPNNAKVCGNLVYFDGNGSNNNDSAQQVSSNAVNLTTFNWRKTGSTFLRWTTSRDGTGVQYANGALFPFSARITTLYAQWGVRETVDDSAITLGDSICDLLSTASDGSAGKPYLVGSALQLAEVNDCNDDETYKYYRQISTIDLTPTSDGSQDGWNDTRVIEEEANRYSTGGWVPIGDLEGNSDLFADRFFSGSYDGNDKSITGMTINRDSSSYQGLFGKTHVAEIKNLTVGSSNKAAAGSIQNSGERVGAVVGEASYTNFKNVHVKNIDIMGSGRYVGGLVGYARHSNATNVSFLGNMISTTGTFQDTGGIFGLMGRSNIKNANVAANLSCDFYTVEEDGGFWTIGQSCGGIAGNLESGSIGQVKYTGDVTASSQVGGIVGRGFESVIDFAEFNGNLFASNGNNAFAPAWAQKVGGIVGYFRKGTVSNVASNGNVIIDSSGEDRVAAVGGIAGDFELASLLNAVSNGDLRINARGSGSANRVGGIVGEVDSGGIHNVASNGNVTIDTSAGGSANNVGGLLGRIEYSALSHGSAKGNVEITKTVSSNLTSASVGGAVGYSFKSGIVDVQVLGDVSVVDGTEIGGILGGGTNGSSVSKSSFSGDLKSISNSTTDEFADVGGAVGAASDGFHLSSTSVTNGASVSVAATFERVGGLIGYARTGVLITDSYNRAPVSGFNLVGGILGLAEDKSVTVYNTYNTGTVTPGPGAEDPDNDVFAAGGNFKEGLSRSNTFDLQTTGATTSATGVVGNSTAAMKSKSTFEALGFDFSSSAPIWAIDSLTNDGYPYLMEARLSTQPAVAPTPSPSASPTTSPSASPTTSPSASPTTSPSASPTTSPSASPSSTVKSLKVTVVFSENSSKLTATEKNKLLRAIIRGGSKVSGATVVGYVQRGGSSANDMALSAARAKVVARFLAANGVKVRLVSMGKGALDSSTSSRKAVLNLRYAK